MWVVNLTGETLEVSIVGPIDRHRHVTTFDQTTFAQRGERSDGHARPMGAEMEPLSLDPYVLMRIDAHP